MSGLGKTYTGVRVLDDVCIRFEAGHLTGIVGPSGAGKTTLLRIVAGFVTPEQGSVRIDGTDVTDDAAWKRLVGMVFQSCPLFPHMSVRENVAFGLSRRGIRGAEADRATAGVLDLVRLRDVEKRRPKEISGEQEQKIALARAIVTGPKVLLLDNPLAALDRALRRAMQAELRRIQRESGLTMIFVTHDREEASILTERIAFLDRGRIVQNAPPARAGERPPLRLTAAGDADLVRIRSR